MNKVQYIHYYSSASIKSKVRTTRVKSFSVFLSVSVNQRLALHWHSPRAVRSECRWAELIYLTHHFLPEEERRAYYFLLGNSYLGRPL